MFFFLVLDLKTITVAINEVSISLRTKDYVEKLSN